MVPSRRRNLFRSNKNSTSPRNNFQVDSHLHRSRPAEVGALEQPNSSSSKSASMSDSHRELEIPVLFTSHPPIKNVLNTESSILQDSTVEQCLPFLTGSEGSATRNAHGLPPLERQKHVTYLHQSLQDLPAGYVSQDSSRPWMLYWALTGLCLLGEDVTIYRERIIQTLSPMQNSNGGFGGGHGQMSHCAPTYAAVLSLAMVGGEEALGMINRKTMWRWLGSLKQPDGGFEVCIGGEEDVRGAYCSMVIISLLCLPLELPTIAPARQHGLDSFISNLSEYLSRCQTYEGGISGSPDTEAHGAYAFCALACLCILGPPHKTIPAHLNVSSLLSWLSSRQHAPEGGFSGRTNKLVDGCYSHWVGGCWPLISAALDSKPTVYSPDKAPTTSDLYSRNGLIRYVLSCCQGKRGGLRDKPGKYVDPYHSCYTLAGLTSAQHATYYRPRSSLEYARHPLPDSIYQWAYQPLGSLKALEETRIFEDGDRLLALHPIYVIPWPALDDAAAWFASRSGFRNGLVFNEPVNTARKTAPRNYSDDRASEALRSA